LLGAFENFLFRLGLEVGKLGQEIAT
jgi:hypothetical protein